MCLLSDRSTRLTFAFQAPHQLSPVLASSLSHAITYIRVLNELKTEILQPVAAQLFPEVARLFLAAVPELDALALADVLVLLGEQLQNKSEGQRVSLSQPARQALLSAGVDQAMLSGVARRAFTLSLEPESATFLRLVPLVCGINRELHGAAAHTELASACLETLVSR